MRRVSLNARLAFEAEVSDEIEIVLIQIEHSDLATPVRLSTDPTVRLSSDPLMYGTHSDWLGAADGPFLFILASAEMPSDQEDAPAAARIILENVDGRIAGVLREMPGRAVVHLGVVLASSPDVVEVEYLNLQLLSSSGDVAQISLSIGRRPVEEEAFPSGRFTKARFPGLFA